MQIKKKAEFNGFRKALTLKADDLITMIEKANLRGRGGANFPTAMKWKFTMNAAGAMKYLICNFDEGEPGTFKDKFIGDHNPDLIIEGMAIGAYIMGATKGYIYLRGEYCYLKPKLEKLIETYQEELKKIGFSLSVFLGAGAYICGDETSIMNSIEGIRPEPRAKPPYPAQSGLWGYPTCINNVETLANVPLILLSYFEEKGWKDLRLYSLSGNVTTPGIYELPEKISMKMLLQRGSPQKPIKAFFFGCAGGCLPYQEEFILSEENMAKYGAQLGSATVIAVAEEESIPHLCKNIAEFFVHESCGKCVPCREGAIRTLEILEQIISGKKTKENIQILENLIQCMEKASFCGLGQTAGMHVKTALRYFREEFE